MDELEALYMEELRVEHEAAELARLMRALPPTTVQACIDAWRKDQSQPTIKFHVQESDLPF